ncbi:hypothetical protein LdCL_340034100 [Leishmania donovani]|uniref:Uncharacterized protein n=1 Tax=Leishmania donovani TaxID=5661 RepID=A0A3Q8IL90_LEIDO|nr:hypothetical protein LdCL_340034100 [Leishmania donovani]
MSASCCTAACGGHPEACVERGADAGVRSPHVPHRGGAAAGVADRGEHATATAGPVEGPPLQPLSPACEHIRGCLDALGTEVCLDTDEIIASKSSDVDELLAAPDERRVSPTVYMNRKRVRAIRQLQTAWGNEE